MPIMTVYSQFGDPRRDQVWLQYASQIGSGEGNRTQHSSVRSRRYERR